MYLVVILVIVLYSFKNGYCFVNCRLVYRNRLETAFQCAVFFDMLAIFRECCRADNLQFTSRKRGLEDIRRVHRTVRVAARTHEIMHFVNEQHNVARVLNLIDKRLNTALKLSAELSSRDKRGEVKQVQFLALKSERNIAARQFQCDTLRDCSFADARFTDKARIVFRSAGKYLQNAVYFLFTSDNRIYFSLFRLTSKVCAEGFKTLALFVGFFRFLASFFLIGILFRLLFVGRTAEQIFQEIRHCTCSAAFKKSVVILGRIIVIDTVRTVCAIGLFGIISNAELTKHILAEHSVISEKRLARAVEIVLRNTHLLQIIVHLRKSQFFRAFYAKSLVLAFAAAHCGNEHHSGTFFTSGTHHH